MAARKVTGEGRVCTLNAKRALVAAPKLNGKVFVTLNSLKTKQKEPRPTALIDVVEMNDILTFDAVEQSTDAVEGARYVAVDGSVKVKLRCRPRDGDGQIFSMDPSRGTFGFIESAAFPGRVFFNVSSVRPTIVDVHEAFKVGQRVKFLAVPNDGLNTSKWRATIVCPYSKAAEFLPKTKPIAVASSSANNNNKSSPLSRCGSDWSLNSGGSSFDRNRGGSFRSSICSNDGSFSVNNNQNVFVGDEEKIHGASPKLTTNDNNNSNYYAGGTISSSPQLVAAAGADNELPPRKKENNANGVVRSCEPKNEHEQSSLTYPYDFCDRYAEIARYVVNLAHKLNGSSDDTCNFCK